MIRNLKSIEGITAKDGWRKITPDDNNDWLDQVDKSFDQFMVLGDKKDKAASKLFENYSNGIMTGRDAWCYSGSRSNLENNIETTISFYNSELARFGKGDNTSKAEDFVDNREQKISWSRGLRQLLERGRILDVSEGQFIQSSYRPFTASWLYHSKELSEISGKMRFIYPNSNIKNFAFMVSGIGTRGHFHY